MTVSQEHINNGNGLSLQLIDTLGFLVVVTIIISLYLVLIIPWRLGI